MRVYVVANLDTDYGPDLRAVHKSRNQAEITLNVLRTTLDRWTAPYYSIYEMELEE